MAQAYKNDISLSQAMKVRVVGGAHIEFITVPEDKRIPESGVSCTSNFWEAFVPQIPRVTQLLSDGKSDLFKIYRGKYCEVKDTIKYKGPTVLIITLNRAGEQNFNLSVKFTPSEWAQLVASQPLIDQMFKDQSPSAEEGVVEQKALLFNWKGGEMTSKQPFFSKADAEKDAFEGDHELMTHCPPQDIRVVKEFVEPYTSGKFMKYCYSFILNKQARKIKEELAEDEREFASFFDCLQSANVPACWVGMMFTQFFLRQGISPTSDAKAALEFLVEYVSVDELLDKAFEIAESDTDPFFLFCNDLWQDMEEKMPLAVN